jgi:hypothetical protein
MTPQREKPSEPHDRMRAKPRASDLRPILPWIDTAAREVSDHLRAFAQRYPDRFEFKDGKLRQKREPA